MSFDHKSGGFELPDQNRALHDIQKQQRGAGATVTVVLVLIAAAAGWYWYSSQPDPLDMQMRVQAAQIEKAVMRFYADEADYPDSLEQVTQYFPASGVWPLEPYNGESMRDTGTDEFDPNSCVGMVHFERLDKEGKTGYRIAVFGREGILETRWGGYAMDS